MSDRIQLEIERQKTQQAALAVLKAMVEAVSKMAVAGKAEPAPGEVEVPEKGPPR